MSVYKGLRWTHWKYMYRSYAHKTLPKNTFAKVFACVSNSYILYSDGAATIAMEDTHKTFFVTWRSACAISNDNLLLTIKGYRKNAQLYMHTVVLLLGEPQQLSLHWSAVDTIKLESSGGNAHRGTTMVGDMTFAVTSLRLDLLRWPHHQVTHNDCLARKKTGRIEWWKIANIWLIVLREKRNVSKLFAEWKLVAQR